MGSTIATKPVAGAVPLGLLEPALLNTPQLQEDLDLLLAESMLPLLQRALFSGRQLRDADRQYETVDARAGGRSKTRGDNPL
jgi:hypothetical protein